LAEGVSEQKSGGWVKTGPGSKSGDLSQRSSCPGRGNQKQRMRRDQTVMKQQEGRGANSRPKGKTKNADGQKLGGKSNKEKKKVGKTSVWGGLNRTRPKFSGGQDKGMTSVWGAW